MFQCVLHHPQGELHVLAQNRQLFTKLFHKMCSKVQNIPLYEVFPQDGV